MEGEIWITSMACAALNDEVDLIASEFVPDAGLLVKSGADGYDRAFRAASVARTESEIAGHLTNGADDPLQRVAAARRLRQLFPTLRSLHEQGHGC